jgi:CheY-like chemotaxis protein
VGILVADDEAAVRTLLETLLRRHGYVVWSASDGAEALELFACHREAIALVLLDVRMPSLDGPQTLAALRQLDPDVRCCFMSGQSGSYRPEELLELGALRLFKKPFKLNEILAELELLTADHRLA